MIGARIGAGAGKRIGPAIGVGVDPFGASSPSSMASVTRDATSNIYCPANLTEWATTLAVAGISTGNPSALWLCQEASGNLADSIGTFVAAAGGTGLSYQNAVSGWTRKAIQTTEATAGRWSNIDAGIPDISTTSLLLLGYANVLSAPAATRSILEFGTTVSGRAQVTLTPKFSCQFGGNVGGPGAASNVGAVRPYAIKVDRTNSINIAYDDAEKLTATFAATLTGKRVALGGVALLPATTQHLYAVAFFGSAAELIDAKVKTLLQTLGWSPLWT